MPVAPELLPDAAKALVFDCDGTLLDSMLYHFEAWDHTCKQFGLEFSPQLIVEQAGKPVHELFNIVVKRSGKGLDEVDREAFFKVKNAYYQANDKPVPLIEPVMEIVREGVARGLPMAVASGGTRHHVIKGLTSTGILDLFKAIVCGEDVENGKPAPDAFLLAAKQLGVEPQHCVGYEDAKLGMQAIEAAGFLAAVDVTQLPGYPHLC